MRQTIVAALMFVAGCASTQSTLAAKDSDGVRHLYTKPCADIWAAAISVMREHRAGVVEEHRDEGYMVAESSSDFGSNGTFMAAWLEPAAAGCLVTIVTKRRFAVDNTHLEEGDFHHEVAMRLGLPAPPPAWKPWD